MALLHSPRLLIADEPTSALDVITQGDVLALLSTVGVNERRSMLFISHDLPAVASICSRVAILHEGAIVEDGPVDRIIHSPQHSYTKRLVESVPQWG
jgi:ABC-type dipeptide/oligopeptide/nickel transport system ATPase component